MAAAQVRELRNGLGIAPDWAGDEDDGLTFIPPCVRQRFMLKTFSLIAMQTMLIAWVMLTMEALAPWGVAGSRDSMVCRALFCIMGFATLVLILLMHVRSKEYPLNYCLLGVFTFTTGVFWSLAGNVVNLHLQFQLLAFIGGTLLVAVGVMATFTVSDVGAVRLLAMALLAGWTLCFAGDYAVVPCLGGETSSVPVAAGVCLFLFLMFLCDASRVLVRCDPDDFMRVIIAFDASMLVVLNVPIFIAAVCLVRCRDMAAEAQADNAATEAGAVAAAAAAAAGAGAAAAGGLMAAAAASAAEPPPEAPQQPDVAPAPEPAPPALEAPPAAPELLPERAGAAAPEAAETGASSTA